MVAVGNLGVDVAESSRSCTIELVLIDYWIGSLLGNYSTRAGGGGGGGNWN